MNLRYVSHGDVLWVHIGDQSFDVFAHKTTTVSDDHLAVMVPPLLAGCWRGDPTPQEDPVATPPIHIGSIRLDGMIQTARVLQAGAPPMHCIRGEWITYPGARVRLMIRHTGDYSYAILRMLIDGNDEDRP